MAGVWLAGAGRYGCIVLTTREWFDKCLDARCEVFQFPPGSQPPGINNLTEGSVCLVLAKPSLGSPRSEWEFLGEFTVEKVARVDAGEFEEKYRARAVEVGEAPFPRNGESTWVIQFSGLTAYERPVKLGECSDIGHRGGDL
ncbi:hypothetical protein WLZ34_06830 [Thermogladius sp. KZ2Tp1]|uniref:hypothetical protein n=1 Tax=Thermogladius sp. KZ2Tp1 TaxID=3136289 RepID=UPI003DAA4B7E